MPAGLSSFNVRGPVEFAPGHIILPTGGLWGYVHSSGAAALSNLPPGMVDAPLGFYTTVNAALAATRANRGDYIICLPGHVETLGVVDAFANLVAGTTIMGVGQGTMRPTFHWSVAATTVLLNVANCSLENLNLNLAGDPTLTTAITGVVGGSIQVSADGCAIRHCRINTGVDSDQIITVGILVSAGGDWFTLADNFMAPFGSADIGITTADIPTAGTVVRITGADGVRIERNVIIASTTTVTDGVLEGLTTLSSNCVIDDNFFHNNASDSTTAVDFGALVMTGVMRRNLLKVTVDATAQATIFTASAHDLSLGTDGDANHTINNVGERGLVLGAASV